jgi:hypothetical protein
MMDTLRSVKEEQDRKWPPGVIDIAARTLLARAIRSACASESAGKVNVVRRFCGWMGCR